MFYFFGNTKLKVYKQMDGKHFLFPMTPASSEPITSIFQVKAKYV